MFVEPSALTVHSLPVTAHINGWSLHPRPCFIHLAHSSGPCTTQFCARESCPHGLYSHLLGLPCQMPSALHATIILSGLLLSLPSAFCPDWLLSPTLATSQDINKGVLQECGLGDIEWQHFGSAPPASALCCCLPPSAALQPSWGVCERVHPAGVLPHSQ